MFHLSMDQWDGVFCKTLDFELSANAECEKYLRQLDASKHTCLSVTPVEDEDFVMAIGGGLGQFIVTKQVGFETFWILVGPRPHDLTRVTLCVGGQFGDYDARHIVGFDLAYRALTALISGQEDVGLDWEFD